MDRVGQLAELLKSMTAVDLAPRLERGMPKYPAHPHLIIDPTVTHARNGYYCQTLSMPEHIGCHVDAPAHTVPTLMEATVDTLAAVHLNRMPTRNELLGRAQAMFARTRSMDEIVDRAYQLLLESVGSHLAASLQLQPQRA